MPHGESAPTKEQEQKAILLFFPPLVAIDPLKLNGGRSFYQSLSRDEPLSNCHFKFHLRQAAGQLPPPSEKDPPALRQYSRLSYRIISGNCNAVWRQCILQLAFVLSALPTPLLFSPRFSFGEETHVLQLRYKGPKGGINPDTTFFVLYSQCMCRVFIGIFYFSTCLQEWEHLNHKGRLSTCLYNMHSNFLGIFCFIQCALAGNSHVAFPKYAPLHGPFRPPCTTIKMALANAVAACKIFSEGALIIAV